MKTFVQAMGIALLLTVVASAAAVRLKQAKLENESIAGATKAGTDRVWTWGDQLREWSIPDLTSRVLAAGPWGEGGCAVDLDRDGKREFVAVRARPGEVGDLRWLPPGGAQAETIDTQSEVHDCIEATLFGRRGVLAIQRGIQIRFYNRHTEGWQRRDIYSIYTPSYQGGLALADVNKDGRVDIFCGNYWIRSPSRFELPWRLFAINTHSKDERSATFRLEAVSAAEVVVAQSHMEDALVARYRRPSDPTLQWREQRLGGGERIVRPHGLLAWHSQALVAEQNGTESRLLLLRPGAAEIVATIPPAATLLRSGAKRIFLAAANGVELWRID